MKKILKKICLISIILCMSFLFIDNVQALYCKDLNPEKECTGVTDELGDKCVAQKIDGKLKCVPKNCNSYNSAPYDISTDCEKDTRCTKKRNICLPKNNTEIVVSEAKYKCSDVKYLTTAWLFIRIAAPFMIVLFGSLDFFKAVAAGDEKKMKESKTNFVKRLIAFLLLILLPFVVQLIFTFMGTYGSNNICLLKCITTNDTSEKGCD